MRTVIVLLALFALAKFCRLQTDGFTLLNIAADLPTCVEEIPSKETLSLLDQKFFYWTKGAQNYVFLSEDGKTVLKFFKFQHMLLPFLQEKKKKKQEAMEEGFKGYQLAFERLKEESGLLYIHLGKSSGLQKTVTLVDKLNISHQIRADEYAFILQKKGELLIPTLKKFIEAGDFQGAKGALEKVLQLIVVQNEKGVANGDLHLSKNYGFVEGSPLLLDCGRLMPGKSLRVKAGALQGWLAEESPELAHYFEKAAKKYEIPL